MSTVEIGRLLGVTRQRADFLSRSDGFPAPVAELAIGRVWSFDQIEEWAARRGRPLNVGAGRGTSS